MVTEIYFKAGVVNENLLTRIYVETKVHIENNLRDKLFELQNAKCKFFKKEFRGSPTKYSIC